MVLISLPERAVRSSLEKVQHRLLEILSLFTPILHGRFSQEFLVILPLPKGEGEIHG